MDGINPYGALSSQKTTWPVILCVYNFSPWLYMKRKYLMMPLVISGPKQPGNDIDVYLAPLIEHLSTLWKDGIEVFDASKQERFTVRAMIFCTINDFPAYRNLSGHKVKGENEKERRRSPVKAKPNSELPWSRPVSLLPSCLSHRDNDTIRSPDRLRLRSCSHRTAI